MSRQIIISLLDMDLYKFTMQQAVLQLFPEVVVTYRFKNRGNQRFNANFLQKLQEQLQLMSQIQLSQLEYSYIKANIPFFKSWYIEYLRNYRFNPDEVNTSLSEDNDLVIDIQGTWASTILWEVLLMAIISELYFTEIETKWDFVGQSELAQDKIGRLSANNCLFADFGTRRRRSHNIQDNLIAEFVRYPKNDYGPIKKSTFVGTSNVHFAMKWGVKTIGTCAHEWTQAMQVLESLNHCNRYALENWIKVYGADLGIALSDTVTTDVFLKDFNKKVAMLYSGVRQDSGDCFVFTDKIIKHYKKIGIDPLSKTIIFSDSLNVEKAIKIKEYCEGKIQCSFGIGTHFTNNGFSTPALNMVIKLYEVNGCPVVKLSDVEGKENGDIEAIKMMKWIVKNQLA